MTFLEVNSLLDPHQHAFRSLHSCDTAVICVHDAATSAIDAGKIMLLTLLDLSSAFDVVDQALLEKRLFALGIRDSALSWILSYLSGRTQSVTCNTHSCEFSRVTSGVPLGSVLGPILFSRFMAELSAVFAAHPHIRYVIHADDIQLYITCALTDIYSAVLALENCLKDVSMWLAASLLTLNTTKTELIIFSSKAHAARVADVSVVINGVPISPTISVRSLGVILDQQLNMESHVNQVTKSAFSYLRVISKARRFISSQQAAMLVQSLVLSRIEFCTFLWYGLPLKTVNRLQRILRFSIRLVDGLERRADTTPALQRRQWLSVPDRAKVRMAVLTYLAINYNIPRHLANLLSPASSGGHGLRSENTGLLTTRRTRTKTGDRAYRVAAPAVWNSLPVSLRTDYFPDRASFRNSVVSYFLQCDK